MIQKIVIAVICLCFNTFAFSKEPSKVDDYQLFCQGEMAVQLMGRKLMTDYSYVKSFAKDRCQITMARWEKVNWKDVQIPGYQGCVDAVEAVVELMASTSSDPTALDSKVLKKRSSEITEGECAWHLKKQTKSN